MKILVNVFLKNGVLDPREKAIERVLHSLNFNEIKEARVAKQIVLDLDKSDEQKAKEHTRSMYEEFLVNSVIEDYRLIVNEK